MSGEALVTSNQILRVRYRNHIPEADDNNVYLGNISQIYVGNQKVWFDTYAVTASGSRYSWFIVPVWVNEMSLYMLGGGGGGRHGVNGLGGGSAKWEYFWWGGFDNVRQTTKNPYLTLAFTLGQGGAAGKSGTNSGHGGDGTGSLIQLHSGKNTNGGIHMAIANSASEVGKGSATAGRTDGSSPAVNGVTRTVRGMTFGRATFAGVNKNGGDGSNPGVGGAGSDGAWNGTPAGKGADGQIYCILMG